MPHEVTVYNIKSHKYELTALLLTVQQAPVNVKQRDTMVDW